MRTEARPRRPLALVLLGTLSGVVLGCVLLLSAYTKAADPGGFAEGIVRDGLLPEALSFPAALLVIAVEGALGVALVCAIRRPAVLFPSTLLMAGFLLLAGWQWAFPSEDASNCGCFGAAIQQTPAEHFAVNSYYFALACLAWLGRRREPTRSVRPWALVPAAAFVATLAFALLAPRLPLDGLWGVTTLREGFRLDEPQCPPLPAELVMRHAIRVEPCLRTQLLEVIPELESGESVVLLIDRADEATRAEIARVNQALALSGGPVTVYGLAEENEELAMEFFWTAAPAFEVRGAPYGMLKPLYRSLPRTFAVRDGRVVKIWNGIPGEERLSELAKGLDR
jgi:hypothetical protein